MGPQKVDMVVVGAGENSPFLIRSCLSCSSFLPTNTRFQTGLSGIAAARFYLEVHPHCTLVVLERDTCLGGVWNSSEKQFFFRAYLYNGTD